MTLTREATQRHTSAANGWLPLLTMPLAAILLTTGGPAWVLMWLLAVSIYLGFKWLTLWRYIVNGNVVTMRRALGYLFAWPGMDASRFCNPETIVERPKLSQWLFAASKMALGAILFWCFARLVAPQSELLAGWIGMIGLIFLLHFGSFHLLALLWRYFGIDAKQLMNLPIASVSLADFWGRRWNTAFRDLVYPLAFRPLTSCWGIATATLATFFLSGLIHDLVISLPAGAGFGLPTLFFTAQGCGLLIERSRIGRRCGLGSGIGGRLFTFVLTAGGAFWLFHPPFVQGVVVPMMQALGAL